VLFEIITSVDNAIVNAHTLGTMGKKARRWFSVWGLLIAVFIVRGALPWLIVFALNPSLGFIGAFTATFSNDPRVLASIQATEPVLLLGGGVFMVFLFLHWLFLEPKSYGHRGEPAFERHGIWFFAIASILLTAIIWFSLKAGGYLALGASIGSSLFFITNGFKQNAERKETEMTKGGSESGLGDLSKLMYLEVIDATFSVDSVFGAFAFTISVPLILIGSGIGAIFVRQLTLRHIDSIKQYKYLKNGAMYSIFFLGIVMIANGFGASVPEWVSPLVTFATVGYFYLLSLREMK
jgi:hypothetical protein